MCPYSLCLPSFWNGINVSAPLRGQSFHSYSVPTHSYLSKNFVLIVNPHLLYHQCLSLHWIIPGNIQTSSIISQIIVTKTFPWLSWFPVLYFSGFPQQLPQNSSSAFIHSGYSNLLLNYPLSLLLSGPSGISLLPVPLHTPSVFILLPATSAQLSNSFLFSFGF